MFAWIGKCFRFGGDNTGLAPSFVVIKQIGYGVEGQVYLCEELETKKRVAIKMVPRGLNSVQQRLLANEAIIHSELSASNAAVVRIKELVLTRKCLGFVMDFMAGGTLQAYVEAQGHLDEDMGAYLFRQILTAVEQCHVHRVAYRDLKSDNCLLSTDDPPRLKLCDFGVSKHWTKDTLPQMGTIAGTPGYLCPEMLKNLLFGGETYDAVKIDIWAMGALLSHMILGHSPFYFEEVAQYAGLKSALHFAYTAETNSTWRQEANSRLSGKGPKISDEAEQLLDIMLYKDPAIRTSIEDIQAHPWVTRQLPEKYERALAAVAEEQHALAVTHSMPPLDMPTEVAELVRKACIQGFMGDPLLSRVNLRPIHPKADIWVQAGIVDAVVDPRSSDTRHEAVQPPAGGTAGVVPAAAGCAMSGADAAIDSTGVHPVLPSAGASNWGVFVKNDESADEMISPFQKVQKVRLSPLAQEASGPVAVAVQQQQIEQQLLQQQQQQQERQLHDLQHHYQQQQQAFASSHPVGERPAVRIVPVIE